MSVNYAQHVSTRVTPQSCPIPSTNQVANSAGGFAWKVDCWMRLDRFLVLGNEGGSYYATEQQLTTQNAQAVLECAAKDPARTVNRIVEISEAGRAPKNDPAIFALAMLAGNKKSPSAKLALDAMPRVCRIGTHIFQFCEAVQHFRGWGPALKKAVARWYTDRATPKDLAHQVTKYQQRNGWSHRDLLRLAKPCGVEGVTGKILRWAVGKQDVEGMLGIDPLMPIVAFEHAKAATSKGEIVRLIQEHGLVRECIPTQWLTEPEVWDALLDKMPLNAMVRNLATMTRIGLLKPMAQANRKVLTALGDNFLISKARLHPISILMALRTYASGHGFRSENTWTPVPQIVDALDGAFYKAFQAVDPTNKRTMLALDVSGSMASGSIAGTNLSPRDGSAAMALVTAATEPNYCVMGFSGQFVPLAITPRQRLDDAIRAVSGLPFERTDCAVPMLHALRHGLEVDTFVIYTDSETWCGSIHPVQALRQYRERTGINAKLVVVGMVANQFSIADPNDAGMMDVVGFDAAVPQVIADFSR